MGCHFLLQRIFPNHGSNPSLLHCRQTLYRLSHREEPVGLCKTDKGKEPCKTIVAAVWWLWTVAKSLKQRMSWRGTSNINRRNDLIKNLALVTQKKKRERESTMVSLHRIFMNVTEEMMFNKKLSVIKVQMRNNETERKSGKLLKGRIHKTWQTNGYFWQENKCHRYHHLPTPHPADTPLEHFTAQPFRKAWS